MEIKTKSGYKKTELGLIPEEWEVLLTEELIDFQGGSQPPLSTFIPTEKENYIRLIQIRDYKTNKYATYIPKNLAKRFCAVDDIMIGRYGPPIFQILRGIEGAYNVALMKAVPKNGVDKDFIYYFLKQDKLFEFIEKLSQRSSGQTGVDLNELKKYPFPLPPLLEQNAIATALKDTDDLINSLESLIAKKKLIKQGAMQELLKPKEGWVKKKLGEVIYLQGGYAFKSNLFTNDGIPIIRISDVGNDTVETSNSVCYDPFNIPKEFIAKKGDILIAMSGATTGKIGVYNDEKIAYINQRVGKFVVLNEHLTSNEFISHVVRSEKFKELLTKEIAQGAQPNISGRQIESIVLPIPIEKKEQVRAANILSEMSSEIKRIEIKLSKLQTIKQGMMQQLLTGKIRLI